MATVSGTFNASGGSTVLYLGKTPEVVSVAITGPFGAVVALERSKGGLLGWETVEQFSGAATVDFKYTPRPKDRLRLHAKNITLAVTNGTFASDTGWTKGTGWTITGGAAASDGSQSAASLLSQTLAAGLVEGASYSVTYTTTRSAGTITPVVGGTAGVARSSAATFTETIVAGATDVLAFSADADFIGTVDTVSIVPVIAYTLSDADAIINEVKDLDGNVLETRTQAGRSITGTLSVTGDLTVGGRSTFSGSAGTAGTNVTATHLSADGINFTTILTLSGVAITIGDNASLAMGALIFTFPAGDIAIKAAALSVGLTLTTGTPKTDTPEIGLGTVIASGAAATLGAAGATMEDVLEGQAMADINGTAKVFMDQRPMDMLAAAAHTLHLNFADGWANVDNTAATASGTVTLSWSKLPLA